MPRYLRPSHRARLLNQAGLCLALLLLGCHAGDAAGGATLVRDSAGVSITTIDVRPDDVPKWELGARAELVISGAGSATSPYFAHVVGGGLRFCRAVFALPRP